MQIEIYRKVLGQIFRHFLTLAAGYLVVVGVDAESNNQLVNTTVDILVGVVLLVAVQLWGYLQKRYAEHLFRYALVMPSNTTASEVKELVASKEPPPTPV